MMDKWLFLIFGGALGTVSRYGLMAFIGYKVGTGFPYGTIAVNAVGCFLAGFLNVVLEHKYLLSESLRFFLLIGFCGAFTTFSSYILDTYNLIRDGQTLQAFANVLGSVVLGFIVFRLGILLGELI